MPDSYEMAERGFIIMKYMRKTPTVAICDRCHLKFITPLELIGDPPQAEAQLRERFATHVCKPSLRAAIEQKSPR